MNWIWSPCWRRPSIAPVRDAHAQGDARPTDYVDRLAQRVRASPPPPRVFRIFPAVRHCPAKRPRPEVAVPVRREAPPMRPAVAVRGLGAAAFPPARARRAGASAAVEAVAAADAERAAPRAELRRDASILRRWVARRRTQRASRPLPLHLHVSINISLEEAFEPFHGTLYCALHALCARRKFGRCRAFEEG